MVFDFEVMLSCEVGPISTRPLFEKPYWYRYGTAYAVYVVPPPVASMVRRLDTRARLTSSSGRVLRVTCTYSTAHQ